MSSSFFFLNDLAGNQVSSMSVTHQTCHRQEKGLIRSAIGRQTTLTVMFYDWNEVLFLFTHTFILSSQCPPESLVPTQECPFWNRFLNYFSGQYLQELMEFTRLGVCFYFQQAPCHAHSSNTPMLFGFAHDIIHLNVYSPFQSKQIRLEKDTLTDMV